MTAHLPTAKSSLSVAPGLLSSSLPRGQQRLVDAPWKKWYGWKRWKDKRMQLFVDQLFTCQLCGHQEKNPSLLVADHVTPHRGDEDLFWNGALQTLCQFCHVVHKQSQEAGTSAQFHPEFLRPSVVPLTIVCGPPGAGKTTYCKQHMGERDLLIDLDEIAWGLGAPLGDHAWDRERYLASALRKRNAMLAYLSRDVCRFKAAWFIVGGQHMHDRVWWNKKLKPKAIIVLMPIDIELMLRIDDPRRRAQAHQWYSKYSPREGDVVIN